MSEYTPQDLLDNLNYLDETKKQIKQAIIDKGQTVSDTDSFRSYVNKIEAIETGIDTSDATATADDLISPKTAYVNGEKIIGSITAEYIAGNAITASINTSASDKVKYVGNNYVVILNATYIKIYNTEGTLLTQYTLSSSGYSFTSDDINRGDISAYSASDNDIKIVLPRQAERANKAYYFRFDCETNSVSYITYYQYGSGMYDSNQVKLLFPNSDTNHLIFFGGQIGDDGTHYFILNINKNSISQNAQIFYQRYYREAINYQFIYNDRILYYNSSDSEATKLYIHYLSPDFTISKTETITEGYGMAISNDVNYGCLNNVIYRINYNTDINSITIGEQLVSLPSGETFKGFIQNSFVLTYNSNTAMYKVFQIENMELKQIYTSNGISINKDTLGLTSMRFGQDISIYNTASLLISDKTLTSMTRDGIKFINTNDATAIASTIQNGKIAYVKGNKVVGTMPNNGELNYIPSDNEQTIPQGYTSGGTIRAADITTLSDYSICNNLAKVILGISPYILLDYIESTGTQYINTGYNPNGNSQYELEITNSTSNGILFGAYNSTWTNGSGLYTNVGGGYNHWRHYASNIDTGHKSVASEHIIMNKGILIINNTTYLNSSTASFTVNRPLYIFAGNMGGNVEQPTKYRLHYFKISENDVLKHHFIPVTRVSDNIIGLYDLVTEQFFTNAGIGEFITGEVE